MTDPAAELDKEALIASARAWAAENGLEFVDEQWVRDAPAECGWWWAYREGEEPEVVRVVYDDYHKRLFIVSTDGSLHHEPTFYDWWLGPIATPPDPPEQPDGNEIAQDLRRDLDM